MIRQMRYCIILSVLVVLGTPTHLSAQELYLWNDDVLYTDQSPWTLAGWGNLSASYDVFLYYDTSLTVRLQDSTPFHFLDTEYGTTSAEVTANVSPEATYHIINELYLTAVYEYPCSEGQYYDIFGLCSDAGETYDDWIMEFLLAAADVCIDEASFYYTNLLSDVTLPPDIQIESPTANSVITLSDGGGGEVVDWATIPLKATTSSNRSGTVNWTLDYYYSNGTSYWEDETYDTSSLGSLKNHGEMEDGGRLQITGAVTFAEGTVTRSVTVYVDGDQIPDEDITGELNYLYTPEGAPEGVCSGTGIVTSNLMTGVAWAESTFMQFVPTTFLGVSDRWPQLSKGGGHIGLMKVETNMPDGFDWYENASDGVSLFCSYKLSDARSYVNYAKGQYSGLGDVESVGLENIALERYRGKCSSSDMTNFTCYYHVVNSGGKYVWQKITDSTHTTAYADWVRNSLK